MSDLPSGAVTLLFTDIEGSTRLVRQLRDRYAEVLAEHQRLLRSAFATHEGHEIDTQGDAFFYAFASAHEAVLAAVDGQRAILGHPWPEGSPVKVRMGIHTGRANPADGRYTGLAVHRAARICAAGHGGQVLVSQATQSLVEDDEEELEIRLEDLGEQRLKDIDRPVRLYQLGAAGLPADFPPPRQEAEPADIASPRPVPFWRRRLAVWALAAASALGLAALVAVVLLARGGSSVVAANSLVEIDARTNKRVSAVHMGAGIGAVAVGQNAVWVTNASDHALERVDPDRNELMKTIGLGIGPDAVAVGEDAVWAAEADFSKPSSGVATVTRIDPSANEPGPTRTIRRLQGPIPVRGGAEPVIAVGGGAVWVGNWDDPVFRLDPGTLEVVAQVEGVQSRALAVGEEGVWLVETFDKTVTRIDPDTNVASASVPIGAREPSGLAVGAGSVWVTDLAEDTVWRIDATQHKVIGTIPVGNGPTAVAATDQAVWVANRFGHSVSRIDPARNAVVATIDLGREPRAIAVGNGSVWVTVA
jgi:YVTN family beta-propeller protein